MENIDFLPEQIKAQRARRRRLMRQGYLLGLCALVLLGLAYTRQMRISKALAELDMLEVRADNVACQLAALEGLRKQQADLLIKKQINDHLGSRINAMEVLVELGELLPESMALTRLEMETKEFRVPVEYVANVHSAARASAAPSERKRKKERIVKRVRLVLTGLAPTDVDVANFIGQLSASHVFEDVNMGYAKNLVFRGRTAREFQASCYVVK